jgi:hypothetical protein
MAVVTYTIRSARQDEAKQLTKLALRSKAHWGYPEEWLKKWREELTVTPEFINSSICLVALHNNEIKGFWGRSAQQTDLPSNGFLFIDPSAISTGCGTQLWHALKPKLKQCGLHSFTFEVDPNAVPFYLKLGAKKIAEISSESIPGRKIPMLRIEI